MQRYLRKYRLTIGSPLSFYEGEVSSELLTTPPERIAQRAVRNEQFAKAARDLVNDSYITAAIVGPSLGNIVGPNPNNNLLDPDRRKYERFITDQNELIQELNIQEASGAIIETLNISFDLVKGEDDTSNHITLYNISNDTRNLLVQRGSKFSPVVKLEAGYEDDSELALVFLGEIVHTTDVWEGATRVTRLQVQSAATSKKEAFTLRSYKKGTNLETIVKDVIKDMRLAEGVLFIPEKDGTDIKIDKNEYLQCQSWEGLVNLCGKYELQTTIEDGKVNVTKKVLVKKDNKPDQIDDFLNGSQDTRVRLPSPLRAINFITGSLIRPAREGVMSIFNNNGTQSFNDNLVAPFTVQRFGVRFDKTVAKLFDTSSGSIIGSPIAEAGNRDGMERADGKPDAIKIKVFLDATIKLHDVVQVKANLIDGIYEVKGIRHYGAFEGREWYTELTLSALDSWVVDTGVAEDNLKALKALQERYAK